METNIECRKKDSADDPPVFTFLIYDQQQEVNHHYWRPVLSWSTFCCTIQRIKIKGKPFDEPVRFIIVAEYHQRETYKGKQYDILQMVLYDSIVYSSDLNSSLFITGM